MDIIDSVSDYLELLQTIFNFPLLRQLVQRPDFHFVYDSMSGVTGPYAVLLENAPRLFICYRRYNQRIFVDTLGAPASSVMNAVPKPDFGGHHPDPNLTYAHDLVEIAWSGKVDFAAASDGDGVRSSSRSDVVL